MGELPRLWRDDDTVSEPGRVERDGRITFSADTCAGEWHGLRTHEGIIIAFSGTVVLAPGGGDIMVEVKE